MNRHVNAIAGRLSLRPPQRRSLEIIRRLLSDDGSLLVLCTAFLGRSDYPNITAKKIPKQVLSRCEWGHDDYSLQVENLPQAPPSLTPGPSCKRRGAQAHTGPAGPGVNGIRN